MGASGCKKSPSQNSTGSKTNGSGSAVAVVQTADAATVTATMDAPGPDAPKPDAPAASADKTNDPDDENNPRFKAAEALLKDEAIGGITLSMTADAVVAVLGPPSAKGESWKEAGTGETASQWEWQKVGIDVYFSNAKGKPPKVRGITVNSTSKLKTKKGIGIGSKLAGLDAAYGPGKRQSSDDDAATYTVGNLYYGMVFTLSDGKVSEVYWGIKGY